MSSDPRAPLRQGMVDFGDPGFRRDGDSRELLDAYTAHARMQQAHRQSVFELRVSLAELDHVTGNGVSTVRR